MRIWDDRAMIAAGSRAGGVRGNHRLRGPSSRTNVPDFGTFDQELTSIGGDQSDPACRIASDDNPAWSRACEPGEKYGLAPRNRT